MDIISIENYYLDLESIKGLNSEDKDQIHTYYNNLLHYCNDNTMSKVATSIYFTLTKAGYLKNFHQETREEKIGDLING